ncbi:MAG: hypothetical protein AAF502_02385 [Bacteroidota bacterium]
MKVKYYKHLMLTLTALLCFSIMQVSAQTSKKELNQAQLEELRQKMQSNSAERTNLIETQKVKSEYPKVLESQKKAEPKVKEVATPEEINVSGKAIKVQKKEQAVDNQSGPASQPKSLNIGNSVKQKELRQKQ